ncbi:hypothetical protein PMAYCL1PPCAC_25627, partial [Pristionchus mayeri]
LVDGQFQLKGKEKEHTTAPEFFLMFKVLCWHKRKGQDRLAALCRGKELERRCTNPIDDNGFKWAKFYHRFEYDPTGRNELKRNEDDKRYNLECTIGYGDTFEGLSCIGGLKDGRCSESECGSP